MLDNAEIVEIDNGHGGVLDVLIIETDTPE